jgi:hypothetical protein
LMRCPTCMAVGHCPECGGKGTVKTPLHGTVRLRCDACDGSGKCPDCNGHGKIRAQPRDDNLLDVLRSQYDASLQRDKEADRRIFALRAKGVEPAATRFAALREAHGIWASRTGKIIAKPRRLITEDSSLYDLLVEDQERSEALLRFLKELEGLPKG